MGSFWTDVYYTVYRACLWGIALLPMSMMIVNFWIWGKALTSKSTPHKTLLMRYLTAYLDQWMFIVGLSFATFVVLLVEAITVSAPVGDILSYPFGLLRISISLITGLIVAPFDGNFWANLWNGSAVNYYLNYRNSMLNHLVEGQQISLALLSFSVMWVSVGFVLTVYAGIILELVRFAWRWPNRHRLVKPHF